MGQNLYGSANSDLNNNNATINNWEINKMAYMTIQINTDPNGTGVGPSVNDLSYALSGGASKPAEVLQNIMNLMSGIEAGTVAADLSVSSSTVAGTVSGQTGGTAAFTISLK